jgi:hypothetical protein
MIKWKCYKTHFDCEENKSYFMDILIYHGVAYPYYETFEEYLIKLEDITRYA